MKKGQAALEYLQSYWWALLIVICALAALIYVGVFHPTISGIGAMPTSSGFLCDKYQIATGIDIQLRMKNSMQEPLTISTDSSISYDGDSCGLAESKTINPNQIETLIFNRGDTCANLVKSNRKLRADINLVYADNAGFSKTTVGSFQERVPS